MYYGFKYNENKKDFGMSVPLIYTITYNGPPYLTFVEADTQFEAWQKFLNYLNESKITNVEGIELVCCSQEIIR